MKKHLLIALGIGLLFLQCKKNDDYVEEAGDLPVVQDFMWQTMNLYYFWQNDVPNLGDDQFPSPKQYRKFLESESDPAKFYMDKLLFSEDRFSFYSEDYKDLTQAFSGISKSNGLVFGLRLYDKSKNIFGIVQYVVPNSSAAAQDIKRGDFFTGVNGVALDTDNYASLLFGENDTYSLNMAEVRNNTIINTDREVFLTKEAGLAENPIYLHNILEVAGNKVGYLVYNSFISEYDEELNNVFGTFKAAGVTDLVLDLRYNSGGSVNSARLLSSMIRDTVSKNIFIKSRYNDKLQVQLKDFTNTYFANTTEAGTPINMLGLNRVFVLTTETTASASELVINGLAPYMEVIQVGAKTTGKNEFSATFVDDKENGNLYDPEREDQINPNNRWALQPLIGRSENADGFYDYTSGLPPDVPLTEDLLHMGILGETSEPLLAKALSQITGITAKMDFQVGMPANLLDHSKMFTLTRDNMNLDINLSIKLIDP